MYIYIDTAIYPSRKNGTVGMKSQAKGGEEAEGFSTTLIGSLCFTLHGPQVQSWLSAVLSLAGKPYVLNHCLAVVPRVRTETCWTCVLVGNVTMHVKGP